MCAHLTECNGYDVKLQSHHTLYVELFQVQEHSGYGLKAM